MPESSGTDNLEAATAIQEKRNAAAAAGVPAVVAGEKIYSWDQLVVEWKREKHKKVTWKQDEGRLLWLTPFLIGVTDIRAIDRPLMARIIEDNREGVDRAAACPQNTTANHYVKIVAAMLRHACSEGWIQAVPVLRKYRQPKSPMVSLTFKKWLALRKELPEHMIDPVTFALATGLRKEKVFGAEWKQVNFEERRFTFQGYDNKLGNSIPLNDTAMEILTRLYNSKFRHIRRIFLYKRTAKRDSNRPPTLQPLAGYGHAWYKAMERAGLGTNVYWTDAAGDHHHWDGEFDFHKLRKTFTTWLTLAGAGESEIDELCGWKGRKSTQSKYACVALEDKPIEHLRKDTARIDAILAGRIDPWKQGKDAAQNVA